MKRFRTYVIGGLCASVMALFLWGCSQQAAYPGGNDTEVRVGINLSLTGPGSSYCRSTEQGIELAKDMINEKGGLMGKNVTLVPVDNHGNADDAATAVQQLSTRHVSAIIGPNMTDSASTVMAYAEAERIPVISPACTDPNITVDAKTKDVYTYMFRATFIDPFQARAMGEYATEKLHAKTSAVVFDGKSPYSKGLAEFYRNAVEAQGKGIVAFIDVSGVGYDENSLVETLRQSRCDAVYLPVYDDKARSLITQIRSAGLTVPLLGADGWNGWALSRDMDPAYLTNLFYSDHYANDVTKEIAETFAERYYEKYGTLPDSYAALGYDSLMMVADAIRRGQSTQSERIAKELARTMDFEGATGRIILDSNHDAIKDVFILTFWEGKPALLDKYPAI